MGRDCDYRRPSDGAPCVMGAWHVTNHYFAEVKPGAPGAGGASRPPATAGLDAGAREGGPLPGSDDPALHW